MKKNNLTFILILFFGLVCGQERAFKYTEIDGHYFQNKENSRDSERFFLHQGVQVSDFLPSNHDKSGKVDYTNYVQQAINKNDILIFPDYPILVNDKGLRFRSEQKIYFPRNSRVVLKGSSLASYAVFRMEMLENVELYSPKIIGDRENHIGSKGEWGMGIRISGSKNIKIYNAQISKCWGDGIYISDHRGVNSQNILVQSPYLDFNRRNGITIVSGSDIRIINPIVSNTYGALPMSGIDIEPNNNDAIINDIEITNYKSFNNHNSGLQIGLSKLQGDKAKNLNINVDNIFTTNARYGVIVGWLMDYNPTENIKGAISIRNVEIINSELPIKVGRNYRDGFSINFENVRFMHKNQELDGREFQKFKNRIKNRANIFIK